MGVETDNEVACDVAPANGVEHFTGCCASACPSNRLEDAQCYTRLQGLESTATVLDCSAQRLAPGPILLHGTW